MSRTSERSGDSGRSNGSKSGKKQGAAQLLQERLRQSAKKKREDRIRQLDENPLFAEASEQSFGIMGLGIGKEVAARNPEGERVGAVAEPGDSSPVKVRPISVRSGTRGTKDVVPEGPVEVASQRPFANSESRDSPRQGAANLLGPVPGAGEGKEDVHGSEKQADWQRLKAWLPRDEVRTGQAGGLASEWRLTDPEGATVPRERKAAIDSGENLGQKPDVALVKDQPMIQEPFRAAHVFPDPGSVKPEQSAQSTPIDRLPAPEVFSASFAQFDLHAAQVLSVSIDWLVDWEMEPMEVHQLISSRMNIRNVYLATGFTKLYMKSRQERRVCFRFDRRALQDFLGTNSNQTTTRFLEEGQALRFFEKRVVNFRKGDLEPGTYIFLRFPWKV